MTTLPQRAPVKLPLRPSLTLTPLEAWIGALILFLLCAGFATWALHRQYGWMREKLIGEAHMVAQTLNPDRLRVLNGEASDIQKPEHLRLKAQLQEVLQIRSEWKRVCLLSRKADRTVVFQVDTTAKDSSNFSLPGSPLSSASSVLQNVFDSGVSSLDPRSQYQKGNRLTAYAPLYDEQTGKILTVVGLDIDPAQWHQLRARVLRISGVLTTALLLLWLAGNALLNRRARLADWSAPRHRYLEAGLMFAAGLLVTSGIFWTVYDAEQWRLRQTFRQIHENDWNLIIERAHFLRDVELGGLTSFLQTSESVSAREFARYTAHLMDNPAVLFWSWVPKVTPTNREIFEKTARNLTGKSDYQIWQLDRSGKPEPAGTDASYFPILYISGAHEDTWNLGFNIGSDPTCRAAIEQALSERLVTSSVLMDSVLPKEGHRGLLVVDPVISPEDPSHIRGFVAIGLDFRKLMTTSTTQNAAHRGLVILDLYHVSSEHPTHLIASSREKAAPDSKDSFGHWPDIYSVTPLPLFGNQYALVARPDEDFLAHARRTYLWIIPIAGGLLITAGLTSALILFGRRREFLYHQMDEQSHALESSLRRYGQLEKQNRTMTWEVNTDGLYTAISDMCETLLEYPPEDIIGQKYFYDLSPASEREKLSKFGFESLRRGAPLKDFRHPLESRSGKIIWISADATPIRNAQGVVTGYWGSSTDITDSKRTEEELEQIYKSNRELVERYRALIKASRTGAWEYNPDPAKMWESPEYFAMLGLDPMQYDRSKKTFDLGDIWTRLLHPDDRDRALRSFSEYIQNPTGIYEQIFRLRHTDGHWIWILSRGQALRDKQGQPTGTILGTHTDITAAKQAEEEIRESRRRYAALMFNLPGMAYRCANDRDWTMEFVSQGCVALTGYQPEDLVKNRTLSYNDLIDPEYREQVYADWQKMVTEHSSYEGEYKIINRAGHEKWVWERGTGIYDDAGNVIALEGFIIDITARKEAEFERERLGRVVEQSAETVVITDIDASIIYVNPAFYKATGYSREEALGQNPRILKSGRQSAEFYQNLWDTLAAGRTWEGEFINKRKDGTFYTERAFITPLRDSTGRVVNYVAVKHDITEERRMQEEKTALQTQLQHSQRMESIGRLAGGVAHDFNNMLQAILGYSEIALMQVPADQPLHADLEEIQKAARRSSDLTRQLQLFARKRSVAPQIVDANKAIEAMFGMLNRLIGDGIRIEWKPGVDVGCVSMDPGHLDQVLVNLVINARDAINRNGVIQIETSVVHLSKAGGALWEGISEGTYVQLTIRDNGSGIPPHVMEHIFEPFFTTKPSGKGTGLGLATVYGIIRQNQGDIRVETEVGKGTTFTIYLPRAESEAAAPQPAAPMVATPTPLHSGTILLVDDEQSVLQTTRRMLESLGFTVIATDSPEKALRLCKELKGKIDLLMTDVIMPLINGPELVERARKLSPRMRYMFVSGYTANLLEEQGIKEDLEKILAKPFTREALEQKLREIMGLR